MTIEGIDTSNWQKAIAWPKVAASGCRFAWIKATEATGYIDPNYASDVVEARAAGFPVGAYHFAQPYTSSTQPPSKDGAEEADWFIDHAKPQPGDLWPTLDLEVSNGLSVAAMQAWVAAFATRVHDRVGVWPLIYTSPSFWSTHLASSTFAADLGCPLWVAHWGVSSPTVPAANWGGRGWTAWQYSNSGAVPGISGRVDLDKAQASLLTAYTLGGAAGMIFPKSLGHVVTTTDARVYADPGGTPIASRVPKGSRLQCLGGVSGWRMCVVNLGGADQYAWLRGDEVAADPTPLTLVDGPLPSTDCTAQVATAVKAATDPLDAQIADLQSQVAAAAAAERDRIAQAEADRIKAL